MFVDTTLAPSGGRIIAVQAGGDLQAALNAAQPGDVIQLQAGASWRGSYRLPIKTTGSGWITVRSSANVQLPPPGTRVGPEHAPLMSRIVAPLSAAALWTEAGAHHYRFVGIEITGETLPPMMRSKGLVVLDGGRVSRLPFGRQVTVDQVPHHLIFDRCYVHAGPDGGGEFIRGFVWNSAWTALIDSHVSGFKSADRDTQAVAGWNGPGPFKIVNNYLEAAGENVLFGGSMALIPNLVPSDIEIRHNRFAKPLSWRPGDQSYAGTLWSVKNLLEFKNARRILIEGNMFENHWAGRQGGFFLVLTPRVDSSPYPVVSDVAFQNNWIRQVTAGMIVYGHDSVATYTTSARVAVVNNVFETLGAYPENGGFIGVVMIASYGIRDLTFEHNTVFNAGAAVIFNGEPALGLMTGFVYRNNILHGGGYGIVGDGTGFGTDALSAQAPGWIFQKNVITGPWPNEVGVPATAPWWPANNFLPNSVNDVGFVNLAGGDYHLAAGSPYQSAGTDGRAIGADIRAIPLRDARGANGQRRRIVLGRTCAWATVMGRGGSGCESNANNNANNETGSAARGLHR